MTVDPSPQGGGHVDIVDAIAEIGDELHLLPGESNQLGIDPVGNGWNDHLGGAQGFGESAARHRLVVDVEPRIEKFAHAGFDGVRQFAGHDDERLFPAHSSLFPLAGSLSFRCSPDAIRKNARSCELTRFSRGAIATGQAAGATHLRDLGTPSSPGVNNARHTRKREWRFIASSHGFCSRWPIKDNNAGRAFFGAGIGGALFLISIGGARIRHRTRDTGKPPVARGGHFGSPQQE